MTDSFLDQLGTQLRDAEKATAPATSRRSRLPAGRHLLAVLAVATPVLAGTAWAATALLQEGDPVPYLRGVPVPGKGLGTVVPGSVQMLTGEVPDPDGGLPWGLRTFRSSRGLVCLQVGRVQAGKLGVLGTGGAFGDDGRFHELRPGVVDSPVQCVTPDGAGNAFLALANNAQGSNGGPSACGLPQQRKCRSAELRQVDYGLLGPKATEVSYRAGGGEKTSQALAPSGGYLVVGPRRTTPGSEGQLGGFEVSLTPSSKTITEVRYGQAGTCKVSRSAPRSAAQSQRGGCPTPPGLTPTPAPKHSEVAADVTAAAGKRLAVRVRFRTPVAVTSRSSAFSVSVYPPGARCPTATRCKGNFVSESTDRDLAAGQLVVKDVPLGRRPPGRYRVIVRYVTQGPIPAVGGLEQVPTVAPDGSLQQAGTVVGTAELRLP